MKRRIRELLRATPFQPFTIHMADGKAYKIEHPDFVLAASSDTPQIILEQSNGTIHFLSVLLMTNIEVAGPSAVV